MRKIKTVYDRLHEINEMHDVTFFIAGHEDKLAIPSNKQGLYDLIQTRENIAVSISIHRENTMDEDSYKVLYYENFDDRFINLLSFDKLDSGSKYDDFYCIDVISLFDLYDNEPENLEQQLTLAEDNLISLVIFINAVLEDVERIT